jgi:hypothetical protein
MVLLLARIADKKRSSYWTNCVAGKAAGQPDNKMRTMTCWNFFIEFFGKGGDRGRWVEGIGRGRLVRRMGIAD